LSQSHLGSKGRKRETAGLELFLEVFEAMSQGGDGFTGELLQSAPIGEIVPKPTSAGGIVERAEVLPEFNAEVLVEKVMARAAQELVVYAVASADGAFVEQTGQVFRDGGICSGSGRVLKDAGGIGAPGCTTDLQEEDSFSIRKLVLVGREL
jgi:hypothetical protein